jgi:hypothetical protein
VGAAARRTGARGAVAARVVLTHRDRGADRRRPRAGECGVWRDAGALRAVGCWAVVLRLRRLRSRPLPTHQRCGAARHHARQRPPLRGGQLHLAGDPGPLLLVPRALHRPGSGCGRWSAGGNGVP